MTVGFLGQNRPATRPAPRAVNPPEMIQYGRLSTREQGIILRIQNLQKQGKNSLFIAAAISKEFNNCTMQGVVKQYITGISACEAPEEFRKARGTWS